MIRSFGVRQAPEVTFPFAGRGQNLRVLMLNAGPILKYSPKHE